MGQLPLRTLVRCQSGYALAAHVQRTGRSAPAAHCRRSLASCRIAARHAEAANPGEQNGRSTHVDPSDPSEYVELDTFDPCNRDADIPAERETKPCPRSGRTKPKSIIRIVFADRRWWQCNPSFRHGVDNGRDKGIGVGTWPHSVVAAISPGIGIDGCLNPGNQSRCRLAIGSKDDIWATTEPASICNEAVDADRITPGGVVVACIGASPLWFDNDSTVDGKDAAPSHGGRGEDAHDRGWMLGSDRKMANARPVSAPPVCTDPIPLMEDS